MRAPQKASTTWVTTARNLTCLLFFILISYWSAEWISDHRGTFSQLSLPNALTAAPARVYQQYVSGRKPFSSSTFKPQEQAVLVNMDSRTNNLDMLKGHLTYQKLDALRSFWFEHLPDGASRVVIAPEHVKRWFFSNEQFDNDCVSQFKPILEAIRSSGITSAQELLSAVQPRSSLDWLSLVILLDQIPRNSYRGDESSICFTYFDPLASQIAQQAIRQGIPDKSLEIRWVFYYRNWFYLPLMHSEDLSTHDKAVSAFERMNQDILSLLEGTGGANEYEKKAREIVQADPETAKSVGEMNKNIEEKHRVIIEKFGRYPHRNKALGREMRPDETEFLEKGGDTFGS
ncbi:Ff.00g118890.m01.CDS01 [Fusarium sp. VM40]|nr:Ff.00g118890.m01.CDS01 [Fusarium sp. VM40]